MDMVKFLSDFSVPFTTEGSKHNADGYVNVPCPFCSGNVGDHLGYNIDENFWNCWRCGFKPLYKTLHTLTKIPYEELKEIVPAYGVNRSYIKKLPKDKKAFKLPTGVSDLTKHHKKYLRNRGYDPFILSEVWGVKSLSPISSLDGISYAHRILLPYMWNGEMVSFDSRDVTDKQENKYKAAPKEYEIVEHKNILGGNQEAWGSIGIIVEGWFDVYRLGEEASCTSGIKYKPAQVREIAKAFKKAAVIYDSEIVAQQSARKLIADLRFRGLETINVKVKSDPGNLTDAEAKELIKHIKRKLR